MILTGERMILDRMRKETEIEHISRYQYAKQFVAGKRVLDAACGSGYGTFMLAEKAKSVVGIDISSEAIQFAGEHYQEKNINYLIGSINKLPFKDEEFDVIVSFETIEHVDEKAQQAFLEEIRRVLKKEGILIISTPNKKVYTDERCDGRISEYHIKEFYIDEFRSFLKSSFQYIVFQKQFYAKSMCIISENSNIADVNGYEDDGMYIVAIASNRELCGKVYNSFLMRYPNKYEKCNDYLQVFYALNGKFDEEHSQIVEYNNTERKQEIRITMGGIQCKDLRIDPISGAGILSINTIEVGLEDGTVNLITDYMTNAKKNERGQFEVFSEDFQIYISFEDEQVIEYVNVIFEIEENDQVVRLLLKQDSLKNESIQLLQQSINAKDKEIQMLQDDIIAIKSTKTWRLIEAVRKILHE